MTLKNSIAFAALIAAAAAPAAVYTNAWRVDLPRNPPAVIDVWRGETVALCARTGITNLPTSAEFLWQSPTMGTSWYATNAVATASGDVTAVFAPSMDSGADSYSFFFRVGDGDLYRPRGTLKMQGSPGAVPNEIELPARAIDFAAVTVLNPPWATPADVASATGAVSVAATGGYATEVFWYPTYTPYTVTGGTNVVDDDIYVTLASGSSKQDYLLGVEVDARPTVYAIEAPEVSWALDASSVALGSITNNVLASSGTSGVARIVANSPAGTKALRIPIPKPQGGSVLLKPAADVAGTWRDAVSTNVIALFASADTNTVSTYRFHRETTFGTNGVSTWTYPNSLQLYETAGANTDAHDPRETNKTFAIPALADALRCVSSWRGDWYAHRPFIAVAPHYGISVAHWRQTNTWVPWCVDRGSDAWMTNRLAVTGHTDPGRIGVYADVSVHRFETAFPSNILMRLMRPAELAKLSPSLLNGAIGITASSHNTVHPTQLQPWNVHGLAIPGAGHLPWGNYETVFDTARWLPRDYAGIAALVHNTHLWDSGHLSAFWISDVLVPVGTFTYVNGGWNALLNDSLISGVAAIIEADSDGAETLGLISSEELQ